MTRTLRTAAAVCTLALGCGGPAPTPGAVPPISIAIEIGAPGRTASPPPEATLFLIGDAGKIGRERDLLLAHVGRSADSLAALVPGLPAAAVFLGDNVYDDGVRPEHLETDTEILVEQVRLGGTEAPLPRYFIPGNHDWANGADEEEGLVNLQLQADAVATLADANGTTAVLLPDPGCPGPEIIDLGTAARLLVVDSEWMIRRATSCPERSRTDLLRDLRAGIEEAGDRTVFVLTHHPLATGGPHGGGASWTRRLWRWVVDYPQDLGSSRYDGMADDLLAAARDASARRLVIASGHEHSLQVIEHVENGVPFLQLVSGSAAKQTDVDPVPGTLFHSNRPGYMRVDFRANRAFLTVVALEEGSGAVEPVWNGEVYPPAPSAEAVHGR